MLYACPRSSFIDFEPNNSAGFGGIDAQAKSVDYQLMLFAHISLNVHYVLIHLLVQKYYLLGTFDALLVYAYLHRLIILFSLLSKTTAIFAVVVVFPSLGFADVNINECKFVSTAANSTFVRILRYCSEIGDFGC